MPMLSEISVKVKTAKAKSGDKPRIHFHITSNFGYFLFIGKTCCCFSKKDQASWPTTSCSV